MIECNRLNTLLHLPSALGMSVCKIRGSYKRFLRREKKKKKKKKKGERERERERELSLIHISEPTRPP